MSELYKRSATGKPMPKGSIIADGDIHMWAWSVAFLGWLVEDERRQATEREVKAAIRGVEWLAASMQLVSRGVIGPANAVSVDIH